MTPAPTPGLDMGRVVGSALLAIIEQAGTGIAQQTRLAQGNLATADNQHQTILEFVEQRQEIHGSISPEVKKRGGLRHPAMCTAIWPAISRAREKQGENG